MKLTQQQVARISDEIGAQAIPEETAAASGLHDVFGDQTFFAAERRLLVFEPVTEPSGDEGTLFPIQVATIKPGEKEGEVVLTPIAPRPAGEPINLSA